MDSQNNNSGEWKEIPIKRAIRPGQEVVEELILEDSPEFELKDRVGDWTIVTRKQNHRGSPVYFTLTYNEGREDRGINPYLWSHPILGKIESYDFSQAMLVHQSTFLNCINLGE